MATKVPAGAATCGINAFTLLADANAIDCLIIFIVWEMSTL